ncbi:MAG: pyruvate, phosphate dikinase [Candidatus Thermoplasmatota archaeon]|nr:pyruvate, phosphate dikinase [Candidatus Thermoplasmatota archaeon]
MKYIYFFGDNKTEGKKELKELLGGKGANLAEMSNINIPIPPGFTISTIACKHYNQENNKLTDDMISEIQQNITKLEESTQKTFGDSNNPLLLSVRSGAAVSMPGMMDTILNLGLNDNVVKGLANQSNNEQFAWDSYRRFIQMFGNVVMGISHDKFETILEQIKEKKQVTYDMDLTVDALKNLVEQYKQLIKNEANQSFPQDVHKQLIQSIQAVFNSWNNQRAIKYREINDIKGLEGTAVNVQTMVFGNMGKDSATGVCFTRNPATGENSFYGEYLINAQGEDVVAGIRTPLQIKTLQKNMPDLYDQLLKTCKKLEKHYKDMQDLEFTIQNKELYMLQTRTGKRTAQAAINIAVDMVNEGLINKKEALLRIDPKQLSQLLHKQLDKNTKHNNQYLANGLPASPGAAVGKIVFSNESAIEQSKDDESVILVRNETSPEDIIGMEVASGILTAKGGMTSHAAVVARSMGKCCVSGCKEIKINEEKQTITVGSKTFLQGDFITLDGATGNVYDGKIPTVSPKLNGNFSTILEWADKSKKLQVRTNADTPRDAKKAMEFGAEGIGLCRTEHMFFEGNRIKAVRRMILAHDTKKRKEALATLKPYQKEDFINLFKIMNGKPITIRLLDPPLHEFLPKEKEEIKAFAKEMNISHEQLQKEIAQLQEVNPMLGHRGCRIGISHPEIPEMQAQALFEAAKEVAAMGIKVQPEIMIPLVGHVEEFTHQKKIITTVAKQVLNGSKNIDYKIGTMIEVPRAALRADTIAVEAEFFSFGTNDLTQMTSGFSRDDVGKFIPEYISQGLFKFDPFQTLDQTGVGELIKISVKKGKAFRSDLKLGICGEQGGEPKSIEFCHNIGLDYVSCSPYQIPIARLAAAHASLKSLNKIN